MRRKGLGLVAIALVALSVSACATREQRNLDRDFVVVTVDYGNSVMIVDFRGSVADLRIPSSIHGLPVTAIGNSAFARRQLTSVAIPNTVTYIGSSAFWQNRLDEVIIPSGVTHIGNSAFARNRLTVVVLPDSVIYIGTTAFDQDVYVSAGR